MLIVTIFTTACINNDAAKPVVPDSADSDHDKPRLSLWYDDQDEDGYGNQEIRVLSETSPVGFVGNGEDCDDSNPNIHPVAAEYCDNIDQNCNGVIDDDALDRVILYPDADADGFGFSVNEILSCPELTGYADNGDDCDDSDPFIHPSADEDCGNEVDEDCDGLAPRCRPEGDLTLGASGARWLGLEAGDVVGQFLSMGPDATGDGRPDLLIGATQQFGPSSNLRAGGAYLVDQAPMGDTVLEDSAVRIWGEEYRWGGWGVLLSPDITGDGIGDVVLAAARFREVCVFPGPIQGDLTRADASACYTQEPDVSSAFGSAVIYAGDQNGDGTGDLAVSGTGNIYANGSWASSLGRVYLFEGPPAGTMDGTMATARLTPDTANARIGFGYAMCSGDLNGDGVSDFAGAGPALSNEFVQPQAEGGVVYVVYGPLSGDLALDDSAGQQVAADGRWQGVRGGANAGAALSCGGDTDADGLNDVLVGAPGWLIDTASVHLIVGPADGTHRLSEAYWTLETADTHAGASATLDGDLDGDGASDLLIADSLDDANGEILIYYGGGRSGVEGPGTQDARGLAPNSGDAAGPLASGYDMDRDGVEDAAVGAPGTSTDETAWIGAVYLLEGGQ